MAGRFEGELEDREYLGDGVYAGHDGHHVVVWLENEGGFGPNAIAMDAEVREALDRYRDRPEVPG